MTSSLGCAVPAAATSNPITVTVTSSLTPAVSITASAISVCQGGNVNFTATPTNGGSSPSYQWKVNGINAGSNNPVFSTNSLTNGSQVSVIITSNASCLTSPQANSNIIAITVNPIVTPGVNISASTTNTCGNNQVTFTATATNGGSSPVYQWYVNNQPAGSNSASFTSTILANNDQVYVKLTSNASCLSTAVVSSNTITMSSSPSIFQTGSATVTNNLVCMNFAYQVNFVPLNTSMNSTIQLWQNTNNGAYGLHSTKIYSGSTLAFAVSPSAGPMVHRYYFRMLPPAAAICVLPANTDTTTVVVLNTIQPVIAQNNSGELYVTNPNSAGTYTWQQMGNPGAWVNLSPLVTGTLYALTSNGWYRVAQNNGACVLFSNAINVNSFRTDNGRGIHIYPNPGVEIVTIDSLLLLDKWTSMDIISPDGRSLNQHYDLANRTAITVSVSGLPAGVYSFLFRKENGDIVSRKFLKQ
jgi:hypothetical protein